MYFGRCTDGKESFIADWIVTERCFYSHIKLMCKKQGQRISVSSRLKDKIYHMVIAEQICQGTRECRWNGFSLDVPEGRTETSEWPQLHNKWSVLQCTLHLDIQMQTSTAVETSLLVNNGILNRYNTTETSNGSKVLKCKIRN